MVNIQVSVLFALSFLLYLSESCSFMMPPIGEPYITNVQLVSTNDDWVLLTIQRNDGSGGQNFVTYCKIFETETGNISETLDCDDYEDITQSWSSHDTDSTSTVIEFFNETSNTTASATITRNKETFVIENLPFESGNSDSFMMGGGGGDDESFEYFTINEEYTTYLSISSQTYIAIVFASDSDNSYTIYSVTEHGDNWWYLKSIWSDSVHVYEDVNVLKVPVPCCLCSSHEFVFYDIKLDDFGGYNMTLTSITSDGAMDLDNERIYDWGLGLSNVLTVYDLSNGISTIYDDLDLCDAYAQCFIDPCEMSTCPNYENAECEANYCGGCYAKWYNDENDVTGQCCSVVNCFVDPCQFAECLDDWISDDVQCISNSDCDACYANWYDSDGIDVTEQCEGGGNGGGGGGPSSTLEGCNELLCVIEQCIGVGCKGRDDAICVPQCDCNEKWTDGKGREIKCNVVYTNVTSPETTESNGNMVHLSVLFVAILIVNVFWVY